MGKKIGSKLLFNYIIILIVAFVTTDITFQLLSRGYLIREARTQLKTEGQEIAKILSAVPLQLKDINEKIATVRRTVKTAGRLIDADIIVTNKEGKAVFRSLENVDKRLAAQLADPENRSVRGYVSQRVPIENKSGEIKGYVLLFTQVKSIYALNRLMRGTQLISFAAAGIFAFIIGMIFERRLTGPLKQLMRKMECFSMGKGLQQKEGALPELAAIKTGDEIEELDQRFRDMVRRLRHFDAQQIRFLQNTSHELKTPLMSIQGYAEAIKDGVVEGAEAEESLDIIIDQCKRLKKTVEEITYLSKLENAEESFRLEKADLLEIIEAAKRSIRPLAGDISITLTTSPDSGAAGLYDAEKLERAVLNLLSNAVRYAEKQVAIAVEVHTEWVKIVISDDGPGLKDGEAEKVFDRFYKGEKGNAGIGLAITKAIVEGHGGSIKAYNNGGKGAVFEIVLPQKRS